MLTTEHGCTTQQHHRVASLCTPRRLLLRWGERLAALNAQPSAALPDAGALLRHLQLASQLAPLASSVNELHIGSLLGSAASLCAKHVLPRNEITSQQAAQLALQLLSALPSLAPALKRAGADSPSSPTLCFAVRDAIDLVQAIRREPYRTAFALDDVQPWCVGAAAALRLLEPLAALDQPTAGQQRSTAHSRTAATASL